MLMTVADNVRYCDSGMLPGPLQHTGESRGQLARVPFAVGDCPYGGTGRKNR